MMTIWVLNYFRAFSNIFWNILMALCRVYFGGPRNVGLRISEHPPVIPFLENLFKSDVMLFEK